MEEDCGGKLRPAVVHREEEDPTLAVETEVDSNGGRGLAGAKGE